MKITKITPVGKQDMYDISVNDNNEYVLANGIRSHNTGIYYSADQIFVLGKSQEKDGTELLGYKFTINVEKSRFIKDKTKIPIQVHFEKGILRYSGLLDIAKDIGLIEQCRVGRAGGWKFTVRGDEEEEITAKIVVDSKGKYTDKDINTYLSLSKEIDTDANFWNAVFDHSDFAELVQAAYKIPITRTEEEQSLLNDSDLKIEDAIAVDDNMGEE